ncbi:MAG: DUF1566 domain-containing protein [Chloroflexi bacterium]|nr:DUF1566 domain-containing protein [Chloroflexota bacterium]
MCDGLDNDCDGETDEDYDPLPTSCGVGACASTGVTSCNGGAVEDSCVVGPAEVEVCDGLDNDCDGSTDEDDGVCDCEDADSCCDVDHKTCLDCTDGVHCDMTSQDCTADGVPDIYDPNTGLCWQDPPSGILHTWDEALALCSDAWRLPTISELRTLVRSGSDAECNVLEWDMEWTTVPSGYCGVWDNCLSLSCWVSSECYPSACGTLEGPGTGGCYWDGALSGTCGYYWSASERADYTDYAWVVYFVSGHVSASYKNSNTDVRCVRSGP